MKKGAKRRTKDDIEYYIVDMFTQYKDKLFLSAFTINSEYNNEATEYMACKCCYPYLNATIYYGDESLSDFIAGKKDMKPFVLHEFCHLITDPFYAKASNRFVSKNEIEDERERITDMICNVVLNLE